MDKSPTDLAQRSADALKVVMSPLSKSRDVCPAQCCSTFREKKLELGEEIGRGAFAIVYRGKYLGHDVAVKVLNEGTRMLRLLTQTAPDLAAEIEKEANVIEQKRSKYIVRLLHYSTKKNWMVMEYCANGSLYDLIRNDSLKDIVLDWSERLRWMLEVALGMNVVHNEPPTVLHRDLKSSNILLDCHFVAKVGDFGLSKQLLNGLDTSRSGSLVHIRKIWQPLEVIEEGKYSTKSDVYSFGVVMYEVLMLKCPYGFESDDDFIDQKVQDFVKSREKLVVPQDRSRLPGRWHECLEKYVNLTHECTDHDPEARPDFGDISDRLKEIKQEYDSAILSEETREHCVSILSRFKFCGVVFAGVLWYVSLVILSVHYVTSDSVPEKDSFHGLVVFVSSLVGLLGLLVVFLRLLYWCYNRMRTQWELTAQMDTESKNCICSKPYTLALHVFRKQHGLPSLIRSPFDNRNDFPNGFDNSDASSAVNLPIPAPEVWKDIREGFVCELKGRDDDYLISVAAFCRDHTNDELTQPEWETLIRILHADTNVMDTNTWKRFRDHLSVPMFRPKAPYLDLFESRSASDAGPSSTPERFRQLGNGSSTEIRSTGSAGWREEPDLDVPEMLDKSLPCSLSRCSEVSFYPEASCEEGRGP